MSPDLRKAYQVGQKLAAASHQEKTAFLGGIAQAGKFLLGMGNLGAKGSRLSRISAHHVGMPLGFGVLGAATAEEGQRAEAFTKGVLGGLAFNVAMPIGGAIGKRLLAPGFGGKNTAGIMKGIGFSDDAALRMSASQKLNKPLHKGFGGLERRLSAGNASRSDITGLKKNFSSSTANLNLTDDLLEQQQKIQKLFNRGSLSPQQQSELKKLYSDFSSKLYKGGYQTGTGSQRAKLKGLRIMKGVGTMGGGMGLGMLASHKVEGMMDTHPSSVFDARGGH